MNFHVSICDKVVLCSSVQYSLGGGLSSSPQRRTHVAKRVDVLVDGSE